MTIYCTVCGHPITSAKLDNEAAETAVVLGMVEHVQKTHPAESREFGDLLLAFPTYMMVKNFARIPAEETYLLGRLNEIETQIFKVLGLEVKVLN